MIGCGLWHSVSLFGVLWGAGLGALLLVEHAWNRARIRHKWPDLPRWVRQPALLIGLSLINLSLTPYAYDPQFGRCLYPVFWLEQFFQAGR
jgi:D-alanyl-lipoteichoic acid acyltransferase DltB (MBOAT superfamily)